MITGIDYNITHTVRDEHEIGLAINMGALKTSMGPRKGRGPHKTADM